MEKELILDGKKKITIIVVVTILNRIIRHNFLVLKMIMVF